MGIQGIYQELGPGQRVALSKLAADSLKESNRPFRLAIDIAIWQFQAQAAKGGVNPAIRTLFYRLVRLMGTPIQPVFVFDGPNKPAIKRNKRSGKGDGVAIGLAKRLIRQFGFVIHDAPGEGEAECALLQKHGIVDAVLSEDVDTIMFGCTRTLRNWSAEGKGSKSPTHVTLYDVHSPAIVKTGIDREGMVLVALMSGGDYLPDGIPGCGIKVAYQAAIAGFGKSVCRLKSSDKDGIREWRDSLVHELTTNESKFFRKRPGTLEIPDDFPNLEVLRYYTHPVVSQTSSLEAVRQRLDEKREIQLEGLREFARETFDWDYRGGALKFIRVLGEALLVHKLQNEPHEAEAYVKQISKSRTHSTTDGSLELRLTYIPEEVVPIDMSKELEEDVSYGRDGLALNSDDEFEEPDGVESSQAPKTRVPKPFDVTKPELAWVLEGIARKAVPQVVEAWEEKEQAKATRKQPAKKTSVPKTSTSKTSVPKGKKTTRAPTGMQYGSMNHFVRSTKTSAAQDKLANTKNTPSSQPEETLPLRLSTPCRSSTTPQRQHSKQPTDLSTPLAAGVIASSQVRPRTPDPPGNSQAITIASSPQASPEAIVISSSPFCSTALPPASPSPGPRISLARIEESPGSVRALLSPGSPSKGLSNETRSRRGQSATPRAFSSPLKSPVAMLKQTSMDLFAKRYPPSPSASSRHDTMGIDARVMCPRSPVRWDEPENDGLVDLTADSPTSCRKRHRQLPLQGASPNPRPRRKRLLIPVADNEGYFDEVEVDLGERDRVEAREGKRLGKRGGMARILRMSDLEHIDLSGSV